MTPSIGDTKCRLNQISRHVSPHVATFCFAKEYENNWRLFECQ